MPKEQAVFGYVVPASKHSARSGLACGDTTALVSELPLCLFVPSLSWLNDQFKFGKLDQSGTPFVVLLSYLVPCYATELSGGGVPGKKTHTFLSIPYVCPGPVLIK